MGDRSEQIRLQPSSSYNRSNDLDEREAKRKTFPPYDKTIGIFEENADGEIVIRIKMFQNPEPYRLSMNEFLEGYLDKPLKMDILSQEYEGQLISPDGKR